MLLDRHLFQPVVDAEHAVCFVHTFMLHTCEACWDSKNPSHFVKVKLEFKFLGSARLMIIALHFSNFLLKVEGRAACDIAHESSMKAQIAEYHRQFDSYILNLDIHNHS